jgi:hypothetical protein
LLRAQHVDAKLRGWFSAGSNAYHISRSVYQRLSPAPVEGEKIYQRFGIPLIPAADFRLGSEQTKAFRTYIDQVTRASRCTTFVSKRTANNRRIQILSQVFPDARFVNLVRDGREVAASLGHVDWWNDHVMWWDRDRRTPAQAAAQGESMAFLCAKNWVEEIRVIRSGLESVNPQQILNVRYENLVSEPVREMTKVLSFLGLWPQRDYEQALERLKFPYRPRKWAGFWNPQDYNVVLDTQRSELEQLQYTL